MNAPNAARRWETRVYDGPAMGIGAETPLQRDYWNRPALKARRGPDHPSVAAYVAPRVARVRRATGLSAGMRLLDVGCGDGRFTVFFARVCDAVGVDFSPALLAQARHARRACMDGAALAFRDGAFDVVFEHALLHHLPDPAAAVREMARVSRRWVVLAEPNRANPLMFAFHAAVPAERGGLRCSMRFLETLAREAGLRVVERSTGGILSANWTPARWAPVLARWEGESRWGMSHLLVAEKA